MTEPLRLRVRHISWPRAAAATTTAGLMVAWTGALVGLTRRYPRLWLTEYCHDAGVTCPGPPMGLFVVLLAIFSVAVAQATVRDAVARVAA